MIVYGHNNFKIKSFSSRDLNLPTGEGWEDVTFEVRQRYAHLFWIPFFPIGKLWAMKKKGNSDLYEMPVQVRQLIEARYTNDIKTPFYSWSLFLIAIVVGAFFMVGGVYKDHARANRNKFRKNEEALMVKYPTTGDYYEMNFYKENDKYSIPSYFKVKSYTDKEVTIISLIPDLNLSSSVSRHHLYKTFDLAEMYNYNECKLSKDELAKSFSNKDFKLKIPQGDISLRHITRRSLDIKY